MFGHSKNVCSLTPVKNITGKELHSLIYQNLSNLSKVGFKVLAIVSDNHKINVNAFRELCKTNDIFFKYNDTTVFTAFDPVHIIKNWRNNWLNLPDSDKTFVYPNFENFSRCEAKFSCIRSLYKSEFNLLVKKAPNLNYKSCYPTRFERQKVSLALNIFNEKTVAALKDSDHEVIVQTSNFINIILKWWTIMNIKNPLIGTLKRNDDAQPFRSTEDPRLDFLEQFVLWVEKWRQMSKKSGGFLTEATCQATIHTTKSKINIIRYCLQNFQIMYILPGKVQTDDLERRFGRYRQLSGGNYNVSVQQILESETKIRLQKVLGISSAQYGPITFSVNSLNLVNDTQDNKSMETCTINPVFLNILEEIDEFEENIDYSAVHYIAGYAAFKITNKLTCSACTNYLTSTDNSDTYFENITRGGLTVPSEVPIIIARVSLLIMQILISKNYEHLFTKETNHRYLLSELIRRAIEKHFTLETYYNENCNDCGVNIDSIIIKNISIFSNIILNNYRKKRNDSVATLKENKGNKRRKLQTLN